VATLGRKDLALLCGTSAVKYLFVAQVAMDTFDNLQLPFALFKAPIAHAAIDGAGECIRCGSRSIFRFHDLCYSCFRNGLSNTVIDTELGMVTAELAESGMTHGLPLSDPAKIRDYKLTPHPVDPKFPDETWFHFHADPDLLKELLRTPKYHTWQGERWLFCCKHPMVFRGSLPSDVFAASGPTIESQIRIFLESPDWSRTVGDSHDSHTYYAFTCGSCGRLRYHEDCD